MKTRLTFHLLIVLSLLLAALPEQSAHATAAKTATTSMVNDRFNGLPSGGYVVKLPAVSSPSGNPLNTSSSSATGTAASRAVSDTLGPAPDNNLNGNDNGLAPDSTRPFILAVNQPPAITSAGNTTFTVGSAGTFTVTTSGFPTVSTITAPSTPALPASLTYVDNGDGTATLSGTPGVGDVGKYTLSITAGNGIAPDATQSFTLTVTELVALGNRVWFDTNNNSLLDLAAEKGVSGVTVNLYAASDLSAFLATTLTDANGYYLFDDLYAGDYVVAIAASNFTGAGKLVGYWSSGTSRTTDGVITETTAALANSDIDSDDNGALQAAGPLNGAVISSTVTLGPIGNTEPINETDLGPGGQGHQPDGHVNMTIDFGFYTQTLGNLVWSDTDKNGAFNGGETGIDGVTVELWSADGSTKLATTTTSGGGLYSFTGLTQGDYSLRVTSPIGTVSSVDTYAPLDTTNPTTNTDNNDNGVGVGSGTVSTNSVTTIPGDAQTSNTVNYNTGVTANPSMDFGFTPFFSLGNRVWFDTDNSGAINGNEVGIDGVTVNLYTASDLTTILATQTTANGGYYLFNRLQAGDYIVSVDMSNFSGVLGGYWSSGTSRTPAGAITETTAALANSDIDSDDNGALQAAGPLNGAVISSTVTLGPAITAEPTDETDLDITLPGNLQGQSDGCANMTIDFGFYTIELGNQVWNDGNNNGLLDASETGFDGVTVELWSADGSAKLDTVTTAPLGPEDGVYTFIGLPAGDYIVRLPASNFNPGGILRDYRSSTGPLPGIPYEPAPDADTNATDSDDNGSGAGGMLGLGGYIQTLPVTLTPAAEESFNNATGATIEFRVDLGINNSPQIDLSVTKTDNQAFYLAGGELNYVITFTNKGPADANGMTVNDTRPSQIASWTWGCAVGTPVSYNCSDSAIDSVTDFADTLDLPQLASVTYHVTARVMPTAALDLINSVTVIPPPGMTDMTPSDNTARDTDKPASLDVAMNDGLTIVSPANQLTYTIEVTNSGAIELNTLHLTDTLPSEASFVSASGLPTLVGNILTWPVFSLAPAASASYSVVVIVNGSAVGPTLTNYVTAHDTETGSEDSSDDTDTIVDVPSITSADNTAFTVGSAGTFNVTTSGVPAVTSIIKVGSLPGGVTLTDHGNGTATLAGTPAAGTGGAYPITITASNGVGTDATQSFTLTVNQAPAITSAGNTTFTVGSASAFTVTTSGFPTVSTITAPSTPALPASVTFVDNGDGTATLSGTPGAGAVGTYTLSITASNGIAPDATQSFTLTVNEDPAITSANNTTFTVGSLGTFTVTTTGFPTNASMHIGGTGALPTGVTFTNNNDGSATLAGTPAAGTGAAYPITITASNGVGTDATQSFTLTVNDAPAITSVNAITFVEGAAGTFTVTTSGSPVPGLTETGPLPGGVSFVDQHDGTAILSGTPVVGSTATYPLTLTASNAVGSIAQSFTLTVAGPARVARINSVADTGDARLDENEHTAAAITKLLVVFTRAMNAADAVDVANYSLVQGVADPVTINSASYDSPTFTATLDINGGVALPPGKYTLTVGSAIRDSFGYALRADFVQVFYIDTTAIRVITNGVTLPDGTVIVAGSTLDTPPSEVWVYFSEDAANPAGNRAPHDVTNPANYLLVSPGPNGAFDTLTCLAGLDGDDVAVPVGPVMYENGGGRGPFVARISLNDGAALANGAYQLFICGATSITDLAGNHLNGGFDSLLPFSILTLSAGAAGTLPATGFAPNRVTALPNQPAAKTYSALGDLWLEIPRLGVQMAIVGVPVSGNTWDVSWLGDQAGWLNGTAFPTSAGNSVLTGHVSLPNGKPGPFASLNTLWWGDRIIVHSQGVLYTYEVRAIRQVAPASVSAALDHKTLPWLTLLTCRGYDETSNSYNYRVLVQAVLVQVK